MNGKRIRLAGALVVALLFTGAALNAEIYIKQTRKTDPFTVMGQTQPEKLETIVTWIGKDRIRVDTGEDTSIIVLGDKKVMYMINHEEMTYAEMPVGGDMFGAMAGEAGGEEAKKGMEMAKKMAQSMMGSMQAKVTPTDETKKIKDWTARKYLIEMSMGSMMKANSEAWATEDIKIDPRLYYMAANAMMASMGGLDTIVQEMQKVKGMIVYQETKSEAMGATMRMVEEVVEMGEKAAPAGAWDIPKGYKKG
jgi:hypothetical protein